MPFGPEPAGFAYFAGAKLAGYSAYTFAINRSRSVAASPASKPSPFWAGLLRTGIGVTVGAIFGLTYWALALHLPRTEPYALAMFFALLIPVRILEWMLFLFLVYRKFGFDRADKASIVFWGIFVSFGLDILAIGSLLVAPGGAWIC